MAIGGAVEVDDLPDEIRTSAAASISEESSLHQLSIAVSAERQEAGQGGGLLDAMERNLILQTH